jgi:hypothetical protein
VRAQVLQDKNGTRFVPFYLNRKNDSTETWAAYKFDDVTFNGTNWDDGTPTILYKVDDKWVHPWEWQ